MKFCYSKYLMLIHVYISMKGKKIFDALTDVDEKYIEEARTSKLKKASYSWKKWATIAASLVL